jgi:TnpA family transposase
LIGSFFTKAKNKYEHAFAEQGKAINDKVRLYAKVGAALVSAENDSDVQPDTIHADTQGQSAAIFGLVYLVGIQLQPRIWNWRGLHFYRSSPELRYKHIDLLFSKAIRWDIIEAMLPEMLRVAVSIGAGKIKPSTILRRLATYSRKSKLYLAFRELRHVVRTSFLLEYLSDVELRRLIQSATNKSERFNQFLQWVAFGGGALAAEGVRDEQRKFIKYNHLVANLLIFHNVVTMSKALERIANEGYAQTLRSQSRQGSRTPRLHSRIHDASPEVKRPRAPPKWLCDNPTRILTGGGYHSRALQTGSTSAGGYSIPIAALLIMGIRILSPHLSRKRGFG